jgi:hypothetical protein
MSKYKNTKVVSPDGIFDSKKEYLRWLELKAMQDNFLIEGLQKQVRHKLEVNGQLICTYIADFVYRQNGLMVVEDVKSEFSRTLPVYRIKKKLMKAIHGLDIAEY